MVATQIVQAYEKDKYFANIKVEKATADLLKVYCVFHNHRMAEVATSIIERELQEFKKRLENLRKI